MMDSAFSRHVQAVEQARAYLAPRLVPPPEVVVQTGTGLGGLAAAVEQAVSIPYADIPGFPRSTVPGHEGFLVHGRMGARQVALLQGRFHFYEGWSAREVGLPLRVLALLGAGAALITNAAGGLNPAFRPGAIMVVRDHVYTLPDNPLRGPLPGDWGPRFPDLSEPYDPALRRLALDQARRLGMDEVREGVYVCVPGPSLETPAETRFLRRAAGADAVGMSSIPEVITAIHAGLRVLALSVVANVNDPDNFQPILLEDIVAAARAAEPRLQRLVLEIIPEVNP